MERIIVLFYYVMGFVYAFMVVSKVAAGEDFLKGASYNMKFYFEHWYMFFTFWNAILHMIYVVLRIVEYHFKDSFLYKKVVALRSFLYVQFMFPTTLTVVGIFWSVYNLDRQYIYPEEFDKYIELWENHVVHTLVVVPLVLDLWCSSSPILLPNHCQGTLTVALYGTIFQLGTAYLYYKHGIWMYNFYSMFSGFSRILLAAALQLVLSFWFEVGFRLVAEYKHSVNTVFIKETNKKVK